MIEVQMQTVLLSDIKLLAIGLFMKDHLENKPINFEDLIAEFGDLSKPRVDSLLSARILVKRSSKSPMIYLSKDGAQAVTAIESWARRLHREILKNATEQMATVQPLKIKNLTVRRGESVVHDRSQSAENPTTGFYLEKYLPLSDPKRFRPVETNSTANLKLKTEHNIVIPSAELIAQIRQLALADSLGKKHRHG